MKQIIFKAEQFTPTQFDTAKEKAKFANQFVRFAESTFKPTLFPKWFYNKLSMTFGHIAHYNQAGFYDTFFRSSITMVEFLEQALQYPCYGSPEHTYCDVERAIQEWVRTSGILDEIRHLNAVTIERGERALLARLKSKYEK